MSKNVKTLVLLFAFPLVGYAVYMQIMPKSPGPSSGSNLFSFLNILGKGTAKDAKADSTGMDVPTRLSTLLRLSPVTNDTLTASRKQERDPMIPIISVGAERSVVSTGLPPAAGIRFPITRSDITGIFYDERAPVILVGRKRYQVGSVIRGATITAIGRTSVTFSWQGQQIVIDLRKKTE